MESRKTLSGVEEYHEPVLLREVIKALDVKKGEWYLDCTLGDGGHALAILKLGGNVVGLDVDPQALERAGKRFEKEGIDRNRWKLIVGNFRDLKNLIQPASPATRFAARRERGEQTDQAVQKFRGAIFDLGVSSFQLETPERGFSFQKLGPLDMRMDPTLSVKALDLIKAGGRKELYELFKNLGEEKYSKHLADALVLARQVGERIETTGDLANLVERAVGRKGKLHPATRVFMALRIAVNDELNALKEGLDQVLDLVDKEGHILVISFHSLEDRIVKDIFKRWQINIWGQILTKKPIVPTKKEVEENQRARSAKMRVFQRNKL